MTALKAILSLLALLVTGLVGVTQGVSAQLSVAFLLALVAFTISVVKMGSRQGGKKRNLTRPKQFGRAV